MVSRGIHSQFLKDEQYFLVIDARYVQASLRIRVEWNALCQYHSHTDDATLRSVADEYIEHPRNFELHYSGHEFCGLQRQRHI